MQNKDDIKIVFFDIWGTIATDSDKKCFARVRKRLKLKESEFNPKIFWDYEDKCSTKGVADFKECIPKYCTHLKVEDKALCKRVIEEFWEETTNSISLLKGVDDLAKKISKRYRLGIISNTGDNGYNALKMMKSGDRFNPTIMSYEHKIGKPNPKIYKIALKKAKVKPHEAIMVGDNPIDDVAGPKKVGMHAIRFKNALQAEKELRKYIEF